MEDRPFHHQHKGPSGQPSTTNRQRINFDKGFMAGIRCMEVRRVMVAKMHTNLNSKKTTYRWHVLGFRSVNCTWSGSRKICLSFCFQRNLSFSTVCHPYYFERRLMLECCFNGVPFPEHDRHHHDPAIAFIIHPPQFVLWTLASRAPCAVA